VKRSRVPYILLIPFFLVVAVFGIFPIAFSVFMSFTDWDPLLPIARVGFVGLDNYVKALTRDEVFLFALKNTLIYVLYEPFTILIGFALALVLNSAMRGRSVFRTVLFIPVITSTVALSFVWSWMYDYKYGILNYLISAVGLPRQPFLSSPVQALPSVMVMSIWQWIGLNVVIFLAALQSIPKEYHEAARCSGANSVNCFRHVTVPLIKPTLLFVAITATAGSLQVFTEIYMMTRGGPARSTMTSVLWMYQRAFKFSEFGYGAAMAFILFLIILAISIIEMRLLRRGGMTYY
jgi:multiple sugar transport system permease protein